MKKIKRMAVFSYVSGAVCFLLQFSNLSASDVYMKIGDGSGGGDGLSVATAYDVSVPATFETRLLAAQGNTVHLAAGIYQRNDSSNPFLYSLSIVGAGSASTMIVSAPSTSVNGIHVLRLAGSIDGPPVTVKNVTLNCNSLAQPTFLTRYVGLEIAGSAVVEDVVVANPRGYHAALQESFGFLLTHISTNRSSSFNNISVVGVQADVNPAHPGEAYVTAFAGANYTDQYVYITNLYVDTGTNRGNCAFGAYGRNYVVRNVSNNGGAGGMLTSGLFGDTDGDTNTATTVKNVDWAGGDIVARYVANFAGDVSDPLIISNLTITDVHCDHGWAGSWSPYPSWDAVEAVVLGGNALSVDGLTLNRVVCSWPAVSLPYSTSTYANWHMGVIYCGITDCKNILIRDSVFIPAHTASAWAPYRNWVYTAPGITELPRVINCRDTQGRFYSDNWGGGDLSFSDQIGNKLFGTSGGNFFVSGGLQLPDGSVQTTMAQAQNASGTGLGLVSQNTGGLIKLKTLVPGSNLTITDSGSSLNLDLNSVFSGTQLTLDSISDSWGGVLLFRQNGNIKWRLSSGDGGTQNSGFLMFIRYNGGNPILDGYFATDGRLHLAQPLHLSGPLYSGSAGTQVTDDTGKVLNSALSSSVARLDIAQTFTAAQNLPANGLAVGTSQLVVSGGTVGVGTASPDTNAKIDVAGKAKMTGFQLASGGASGLAMVSDANGNGSWGNALQETAESNNGTSPSTPQVSGTNRFFEFFTLPTSEKLYTITGIEWKNGTTVAGNTICGAVLVDLNPPTQAAVPTIAFGQLTANSTPTGSVQRVSTIVSQLIRGGTTIGIFVQADNNTHTFNGVTVTSAKNKKIMPVPAGGNVANQDNIAWTATTTKPYLKVYYRGYK